MGKITENYKKIETEKNAIIQNQAKEIELLKENRSFLEGKIKKYLENFMNFKKNIAGKIENLMPIKEKFKDFTENVKEELEKQKKESKNKKIQINEEINGFIVKNKDEKEKFLRKIDYLTNVLENLKKTQKNDFEKLNDEKNRLSKEIKEKSDYFSEEQKKSNKEKNEFLSEIKEKTLKLEKTIEESKKLEKERNNLKFQWEQEKIQITTEISKKTQEIKNLKEEIMILSEKSLKTEEISEKKQKELISHAETLIQKQEEIKNLLERIEKLSQIIKTQEKNLISKENRILNLELDIENLKREISEIRRLTDLNVPIVDLLKQHSTPQWGSNLALSGMIEELNKNEKLLKKPEIPSENTWGLEDEDMLLDIPEKKASPKESPKKLSSDEPREKKEDWGIDDEDILGALGEEKKGESPLKICESPLKEQNSLKNSESPSKNSQSPLKNMEERHEEEKIQKNHEESPKKQLPPVPVEDETKKDEEHPNKEEEKENNLEEEKFVEEKTDNERIEGENKGNSGQENKNEHKWSVDEEILLLELENKEERVFHEEKEEILFIPEENQEIPKNIEPKLQETEQQQPQENMQEEIPLDIENNQPEEVVKNEQPQEVAQNEQPQDVAQNDESQDLAKTEHPLEIFKKPLEFFESVPNEKLETDEQQKKLQEIFPKPFEEEEEKKDTNPPEIHTSSIEQKDYSKRSSSHRGSPLPKIEVSSKSDHPFTQDPIDFLSPIIPDVEEAHKRFMEFAPEKESPLESKSDKSMEIEQEIFLENEKNSNLKMEFSNNPLNEGVILLNYGSLNKFENSQNMEKIIPEMKNSLNVKTLQELHENSRNNTKSVFKTPEKSIEQRVLLEKSTEKSIEKQLENPLEKSIDKLLNNPLEKNAFENNQIEENAIENPLQNNPIENNSMEKHCDNEKSNENEEKSPEKSEHSQLKSPQNSPLKSPKNSEKSLPKSPKNSPEKSPEKSSLEKSPKKPSLEKSLEKSSEKSPEKNPFDLQNMDLMLSDKFQSPLSPDFNPAFCDPLHEPKNSKKPCISSPPKPSELVKIFEKSEFGLNFNLNSSQSPKKSNNSTPPATDKQQEKLDYIIGKLSSPQKKEGDPEKYLQLELSDIKKEPNHQNISDFLMEKNESAEKKEPKEEPKENPEENDRKVDNSDKKPQDLFLLQDLYLNKSDSLKLHPMHTDPHENKLVNHQDIIKEVDEENHWGIEDMIDFGSPSKPEIKVNDESLKISTNLNRQFETNLYKAMEFSKEISGNIDLNAANCNFEMPSASNLLKPDEIQWDELKFGKCEVSKLVNSMDRSEIKSSKDSFFEIGSQPAHKRVSDDLPGLTKIHSMEGKKESLSVSIGLKKNIKPSSSNLIINKDLMNPQKKGSNLSFKTSFLLEPEKKKEDINLEDILGNPFKK